MLRLKSSARVGLLVRAALAIVATVSSMALAWTLMVGQSNVSASGINEYPTTQQPWGIALDYKSSPGYVWVAEPGCDSSPVCASPPPGLIGRYNLANPGTGEKDFVPPKGKYNPVFLRLDKNENLWFTDPTHNKIGELAPKGNQWSSYPVTTPHAAPYDLVIDHNGNIWFTEILTGAIGYFNPSTHVIVENAIPTANSTPYGITIDKQGNIWFAENAQHKIGSFTPTKSGKLASGAIKEYVVSKTATPHLLTFDAAGNVWYSEGFAGQVGVYNPKTNTYKEYVVSSSVCPTPTPNTTPTPCTGTHISGISVDGKGLVWFDDSLTARVGNLDPSTGKVTLLQIPFLGAHPHDGLEVDKTNTVWFTELFGYRLGKI